jgi:hypothetical protein
MKKKLIFFLMLQSNHLLIFISKYQIYEECIHILSENSLIIKEVAPTGSILDALVFLL